MSEVVPVAELEGVTRLYRMGRTEVRALDEFSFSFGAGEYWSIMGSSGSGKSTLLNILGCIDRPTSGSYKVRGTEVGQLSDDDLSELRGSELGFVFQSYNLIPQLTVIENILVPVLYRMLPIRKRPIARAPSLSEWAWQTAWITVPWNSPGGNSNAWLSRAP